MFGNAFQGGKRAAESIRPYVKQADRLPGKRCRIFTTHTHLTKYCYKQSSNKHQ